MKQVQASPVPVLSLEAKTSLEMALAKIAPAWPLDRSIAVSPMWEMINYKFEDASAKLGSLGRMHCYMPAGYYLDRIQEDQLSPEVLELSAERLGLNLDSEKIVEWLSTETDDANSFECISRLVDRNRITNQLSWHDEIIFQMSQLNASYFQTLDNKDVPLSKSLYETWLSSMQLDKGLGIRMGERHLRSYFENLPVDRDELIATALNELDITASQREAYAHSLLLDLIGWSSWIAYRHFHSPEEKTGPSSLWELLSIRLGWELILWRLFKDRSKLRLKEFWKLQKRSLAASQEAWKKRQLPLRLAANAIEYAYQQELERKLLEPQTEAVEEPSLQAIFCIDVRSEPIRRALEAQSPQIQTIGMAGFFGLPIEFQVPGSNYFRPQVPGLIKAQYRAEVLRPKASLTSIQRQSSWISWAKASNTSFFMVESLGLSYLWRILKRSFFTMDEQHPINTLGHETQWLIKDGEQSLNAKQKAVLAAGILKASGLKRFAPTVLLVGHGSQTSNNPQAAALDCGACGGQSGEINARVLAELLNDSEVRVQLRELGYSLPDETRFVAALHNTSTEELKVFAESLPGSLRHWLDSASQLVRREKMRFETKVENWSDEQITREHLRRAHDWSEVRPEWGLAGNASFLIGPRAWTRGKDLAARTFLHDYHADDDQDLRLLNGILTAPMLVTHWINMQYNCSMTDNERFGSGNKVLHNVVGGNLGLFEGNGGDLRIGLSLQSLHDGHKFRHVPQRLSVYVAAPLEGLRSLIARDKMLRALVSNEWLYLFHWTEKQISAVTFAGIEE